MPTVSVYRCRKCKTLLISSSLEAPVTTRFDENGILEIRSGPKNSLVCSMRSEDMEIGQCYCKDCQDQGFIDGMDTSPNYQEACHTHHAHDAKPFESSFDWLLLGICWSSFGLIVYIVLSLFVSSFRLGPVTFLGILALLAVILHASLSREQNALIITWVKNEIPIDQPQWSFDPFGIASGIDFWGSVFILAFGIMIMIILACLGKWLWVLGIGGFLVLLHKMNKSSA